MKGITHFWRTQNGVGWNATNSKLYTHYLHWWRSRKLISRQSYFLLGPSDRNIPFDLKKSQVYALMSQRSYSGNRETSNFQSTVLRKKLCHLKTQSINDNLPELMLLEAVYIHDDSCRFLFRSTFVIKTWLFEYLIFEDALCLLGVDLKYLK